MTKSNIKHYVGCAPRTNKIEPGFPEMDVKEALNKPVTVMPAKAGIQESPLKPLDSGFCRNDEK